MATPATSPSTAIAYPSTALTSAQGSTAFAIAGVDTYDTVFTETGSEVLAGPLAATSGDSNTIASRRKAKVARLSIMHSSRRECDHQAGDVI